ncbi:MAG: HNH endonuclease [Chitinophagaceae bacterium]|nr:HNH endonuclease [Chitinophagaceae bacterium]
MAITTKFCDPNYGGQHKGSSGLKNTTKNSQLKKMVKFFYNEVFKEVEVDKSLKLRYAISNYGRLISFEEDMNEGRLLKGGLVDGYKVFLYVVKKDGKIFYKHKLFYKMVAEKFLEKSAEDQLYILHIDRIRTNDHIDNLRWATKAELLEHNKGSERVIEAMKKLVERNRKADGKKLTAVKVILLKRIFADPNRKPRMKMIAKQFGVSEMTLYRIKSGENWGHIKI